MAVAFIGAILIAFVLESGVLSGRPEVPDGFVKESDGELHFARPNEWKAVPQNERGRDIERSFSQRRDGEVVYGLVVDRVRTSAANVERAVDVRLSLARNEVDDLKVVSSEHTEVSGADDAMIVQVNSTLSDGVKATNLDLYLPLEEGRYVRLGVVGRQGDADLDLMRQILDTAYLE